jgi:hypothetical protein
VNKHHKAFQVFNNLCVNLTTYMSTVAAISQIPVSEADNAGLEGPSVERPMSSWHENAASTEALHSASGYGHKSVLKLNIEHSKIMKCVSCCLTYA